MNQANSMLRSSIPSFPSSFCRGIRLFWIFLTSLFLIQTQSPTLTLAQAQVVLGTLTTTNPPFASAGSGGIWVQIQYKNVDLQSPYAGFVSQATVGFSGSSGTIIFRPLTYNGASSFTGSPRNVTVSVSNAQSPLTFNFSPNDLIIGPGQYLAVTFGGNLQALIAGSENGCNNYASSQDFIGLQTFPSSTNHPLQFQYSVTPLTNVISNISYAPFVNSINRAVGFVGIPISPAGWSGIVFQSGSYSGNLYGMTANMYCNNLDSCSSSPANLELRLFRLGNALSLPSSVSGFPSEVVTTLNQIIPYVANSGYTSINFIGSGVSISPYQWYGLAITCIGGCPLGQRPYIRVYQETGNGPYGFTNNGYFTQVAYLSEGGGTYNYWSPDVTVLGTVTPLPPVLQSIMIASPSKANTYLNLTYPFSNTITVNLNQAQTSLYLSISFRVNTVSAKLSINGNYPNDITSPNGFIFTQLQYSASTGYSYINITLSDSVSLLTSTYNIVFVTPIPNNPTLSSLSLLYYDTANQASQLVNTGNSGVVNTFYEFSVPNGVTSYTISLTWPATLTARVSYSINNGADTVFSTPTSQNLVIAPTAASTAQLIITVLDLAYTLTSRYTINITVLPPTTATPTTAIPSTVVPSSSTPTPSSSASPTTSVVPTTMVSTSVTLGTLTSTNPPFQGVGSTGLWVQVQYNYIDLKAPFAGYVSKATVGFVGTGSLIFRVVTQNGGLTSASFTASQYSKSVTLDQNSVSPITVTFSTQDLIIGQGQYLAVAFTGTAQALIAGSENGCNNFGTSGDFTDTRSFPSSTNHPLQIQYVVSVIPTTQPVPSTVVPTTPTPSSSASPTSGTTAVPTTIVPSTVVPSSSTPTPSSSASPTTSVVPTTMAGSTRSVSSPSNGVFSIKATVTETLSWRLFIMTVMTVSLSMLIF